MHAAGNLYHGIFVFLAKKIEVPDRMRFGGHQTLLSQILLVYSIQYQSTLTRKV